jgi:hypothetical protein
MRDLPKPSPYQLFVGIDLAARSVAVSSLLPPGRPTDARTLP